MCVAMGAEAGMRRAAGWLVVLALMSAGCGGAAGDESAAGREVEPGGHAESIVRRNDLRVIALLYLDFEEKQGRPPAGASELRGGCEMDERALRHLREGRCAMRWGMSLRGVPHRRRGRCVLGYETAVTATGGRWVVTADVRVEEVSERRFERLLDAPSDD